MGKVFTLSNGKNLRQGASFYRKNGATEIEWDSNDCVNEEAHASVVEIKIIVFNAYVDHACRLCLGVA